MKSEFEVIKKQIVDHKDNLQHTTNGHLPLFQASKSSLIMIVGQAPGIKAQQSGLPWNDASGIRLQKWLGVDEEKFRDSKIFAHVPMDFYYPGKGKTGDLPPRKNFANYWHPKFIELMPNLRLIVLVGSYAQRFYLKSSDKNITETIKNYKSYLPDYFPIVHPSPLNFRWHIKNPWFEDEVVPEFRRLIQNIIG